MQWDRFNILYTMYDIGRNPTNQDRKRKTNEKTSIALLGKISTRNIQPMSISLAMVKCVIQVHMIKLIHTHSFVFPAARVGGNEIGLIFPAAILNVLR